MKNNARKSCHLTKMMSSISLFIYWRLIYSPVNRTGSSSRTCYQSSRTCYQSKSALWQISTLGFQGLLKLGTTTRTQSRVDFFGESDLNFISHWNHTKRAPNVINRHAYRPHHQPALQRKATWISFPTGTTLKCTKCHQQTGVPAPSQTSTAGECEDSRLRIMLGVLLMK